MSNKIEELSKELDELQAKIKEVQKKIEEAKQAEWPQHSDIYWYMFGTGEIFDGRWVGAKSDVARQTIGNTFRTKEEAKFELERLKVIAELKKFAMSRGAVRKARGDKSVYCLYLAPDDTLFAESDIAYRHPTLYFADESTARKAITAVGEDRVKKYYFGIED